LWIDLADHRGSTHMPTARVRRTETSITRHPLRYACSRTHHADYGRIEAEWADGEGGFYRAYRCSNCEATWVDQHISAEQPQTDVRRSRPRSSLLERKLAAGPAALSGGHARRGLPGRKSPAGQPSR
jgi:hypothetical protein